METRVLRSDYHRLITDAILFSLRYGDLQSKGA